MHYAYRVKIVSTLLLCYYWLEFKETLWEPSIQRGDAHIVLCNYWLEFNETIGIINIKRRWAYHQLVSVRLFYSELWPLISYALCI
jgi:hypothetical protein